MKSLFFVIGILFSQYAMPLMDSFGALILAWVESKKVKHSEIVTRANIRMQKEIDRDDTPKNAYGFVVPSIEEEIIEEEDDEDEI